MRYTVAFSVAEVYVDVEADSMEQARELAEETVEPPTICCQCAGRIQLCDPVVVAVVEVE